VVIIFIIFIIYIILLPGSFVSAEVSISQSKAIKIVYAKFTTPGDTHGRDSRDKSFKYSLRNISHLAPLWIIFIYILIYENCDILQYKKYM